MKFSGHNCCKIISWVLLLAINLSFVKPAMASDMDFEYVPKVDIKSKPARVLNFSRDFSLGEILIGRSSKVGAAPELRGAARGRITVPAQRFITFNPSRHFYEEPQRIKSLPINSIDAMQISATSMDDAEDGLCDRALASITHFKNLITVDLSRSDASDKGAVHLAELPELQEISAFATMIDGSCFKAFGAMKNLKCINLHSDPIKDENLKYLARLPDLQMLCLGATAISDAGIKDLAGCKNLTHLDLNNDKKITSMSVPYLLALKNLNELRLLHTAITFDALLKLRSLPLTSLTLPQNYYSPEQLKVLHKAMPKTFLNVDRIKIKSIDRETRETYAPLH